MKLENVCKKYGITKEEINEEIDRIPFGKMINPLVMLAICDVLANGDIEKENKDNEEN